MITSDDTLLTVAEAADLLRVSQPTIRRWVREGRLKCVRPGPRTVRLSFADLLKAIPPDGGLPRVARSTEDLTPWTREQWDAWFAEVDDLNERILAWRGGIPLPDSVPIIREGRDAGYEEPW